MVEAAAEHRQAAEVGEHNIPAVAVERMDNTALWPKLSLNKKTMLLLWRAFVFP